MDLMGRLRRASANHYFPTESVRWDHIRPGDSHAVCPWKGLATYYDVVAGDEVNRDAAWFYPTPSPSAGRNKNRGALLHVGNGGGGVCGGIPPPPGEAG